MGPRVCHVTFFDQRRAVGALRLSHNVFGSKEGSWGPASVTSRFWIKGGQFGPRVCHVTFLDQRRSVGAPRLSRHVFGSKEVRRGLSIGGMRSKNAK